MASKVLHSLKHVLVYRGHQAGGPYAHAITKRVAAFERIQRPWTISTFAGEELIQTLRQVKPKEALVVIPAGESTRLQEVFSPDQTRFLYDYFHQGARGYFTCGSAYWVCKKRVWKDLCEIQPKSRAPITKFSNLPLFEGSAEGPLCPFPGKQYKVGFYSTVVEVATAHMSCNVYLSGGGSFLIPKSLRQRISVLARYSHADLKRLGKSEEECTKYETAAVIIDIGEGAVLLSMFHPYYGGNDFNTPLYKQLFPDCGTDWDAVASRLSPEKTRIQFIDEMIRNLEQMPS